MKFRIGTVMGVLPYVQTISHDGWGRARGPWIRLPEKQWGDTPLRRHEEFHVEQWYMVFLPATTIGIAGSLFFGALAVAVPLAGAMIGWRRKGVRLSREIGAYGESLRALEREGTHNKSLQTMCKHYAHLLVENDRYELAENETKVADRIWRAFEGGSLFG